MPEPIISRELIARQAGRAAEVAAANPKAPPPPNPYCPTMQPEHHREWEASFTRQLHWHGAPHDGESCA